MSIAIFKYKKGKTSEQKSTTTKYIEKSRLTNTNPTNKGVNSGAPGGRTFVNPGCVLFVFIS
jgi:hypothetical protein